MPTIQDPAVTHVEENILGVEAGSTAPATPAPKAKPAKKAPAKKSPAKKTVKATAAKPSANGTTKKDGLRAPQQRILIALAKSNKPLTRAQLSEKAPCDLAFLTSYIGSHDEEKRKVNDAKLFPSLLTLKLVRYAESEEGPAAYDLTAAGRKAVEKLKG